MESWRLGPPTVNGPKGVIRVGLFMEVRPTVRGRSLEPRLAGCVQACVISINRRGVDGVSREHKNGDRIGIGIEMDRI